MTLTILITVVCCLSAAVVLWRVLHMIKHLDPASWRGERWRFAAMSIQWALAGTGAAAVVLGMASAGGVMLLTAMALSILADRRHI